jgi:hypothetical protein
MKRQIGTVLALCVLLLSLAGCKHLKGPEYELAVSVEAGVTGSPTSGIYAHADLEEVAYKYAPENSQHTVEVLIDDGAAASESSLIIYHDTVLVARLFDPRGPWRINAFDANSNANEFTVMLYGSDRLSGTFSDDRGHGGTWLAGAGSIALLYSDLTGHKFVASIPAMKGDWTWDNGTSQGTWSAIRIDAGSFRWR